MAPNNRGRSVTGEAAVPYYLSTPARETAKHLRLTTARYLADRASLNDIKEAFTMFVAAQPVSGEKGYRANDMPAPAPPRHEDVVYVCGCTWSGSDPDGIFTAATCPACWSKDRRRVPVFQTTMSQRDELRRVLVEQIRAAKRRADKERP